MTQPVLASPCNESWRKMTPQPEGRLCAGCNVVVVDFTRKTEAEIIAYFEQRKEQRTCGKYRRDQVTIPGKRLRFRWVFAVLALIIGANLASCARRRVCGGTWMLQVKQPVKTEATRHTK
jgi:hypothetical protein